MAQPRFLKYNDKEIIAQWPRFERWSAALTGAQLVNSGITAYIINGAGGLQGDPILQLPSIPSNYENIFLKIKSQCAIQPSSGGLSYPLTAINYGCGFGSGVGIVVDGVVNQFLYSGNYGKLPLLNLPQNLNFSALLLTYLLAPEYNNTLFNIGASAQYLAMSFEVSLYGTN